MSQWGRLRLRRQERRRPRHREGRHPRLQPRDARHRLQRPPRRIRRAQHRLGKIRISIPLTVDVKSTLVPQIEAVMAAGGDKLPYAQRRDVLPREQPRPREGRASGWTPPSPPSPTPSTSFYRKALILRKNSATRPGPSPPPSLPRGRQESPEPLPPRRIHVSLNERADRSASSNLAAAAISLETVFLRGRRSHRRRPRVSFTPHPPGLNLEMTMKLIRPTYVLLARPRSAPPRSTRKPLCRATGPDKHRPASRPRTVPSRGPGHDRRPGVPPRRRASAPAPSSTPSDRAHRQPAASRVVYGRPFFQGPEVGRDRARSGAPS